jgi:pimeloyl-ACP methyl ester carboxylesterase
MQTQYLERPEGRLAYSDYGGNGLPVLMLPGMGALRSEYRYLAPRLSEAGYRAITVYLRGHGESSAPWKTYANIILTHDERSLARASVGDVLRHTLPDAETC